ncbi:MAG: peptidyl-tRNA hydrolase Pth2 [Nitrososphaerales archaeon]
MASRWDYKQAIVVRTDLKMGKGKIAVQAAHASILAAEEARLQKPQWHRAWLDSGMAKIALKIPSLTELKMLEKEAKENDLPVATVEDRGLTQIPPGTITCLAIGPAPAQKVDSITGRLKLL